MTRIVQPAALLALLTASAAFGQDRDPTPIEPQLEIVELLESAVRGVSVELSLEAPPFEAYAYQVSVTLSERNHREEIAWGTVRADRDHELNFAFYTPTSVDLSILMVAVDERGFEIHPTCGEVASSGDAEACATVKTAAKRKKKKKAKVDAAGQIHITSSLN
ncbi:MAG: hypothetical protein KC912_24375 [Proteobacteria bacterium]|nr:hypothetical protein [Pseudomonadota bacterium]